MKLANSIWFTDEEGFEVNQEFLETNGAFYDAPGVIKIAKTLLVEDFGKVQLTEQQMMNTFCHELVHCFQFFYGDKWSETQAQVYANFMCEFLTTKTNNLPF